MEDKKIPKKLNFYFKYLERIGYPVLIILLILAGIYGYITHINKKAESIYNSAFWLFSKNIEKGPNNKEIKKALKMFQELANNYKISKYSKLAVPFVAYIYFMQGDYKKAVMYYNKFAKNVAERREYTALTKIAISSCYEEEKDLNKAIKALEEFFMKKREVPFKEFALLALERLYREENEPARAKKIIEEFVKEYPKSPFFYVAKAHLLSYNK